MDLKALEYANFALKSLIDDKPIEKFVFNDALVGIADFLKSEMNEAEKRYIDQNIDVFMGVSNILRIIRLQLNREFTQNRNILKSSHFAISPAITEYGVMDPNESFDSKMFVNTPKEVSQYNDEFEEV